MPIESPVQAFLKQESLQREREARASERKQIGTLRDLQIMREQKDIEEYTQGQGLRELTRQLDTAQTQASLQSLPQLLSAQRAQTQAQQAQSVEQEAQARLDVGEPAPRIVNDFISRGVLPKGTQAFKVPLDETMPELGDAWAVQAPGQEPQIFNAELLKEQRRLKLDMARLQAKQTTGVTPEPREVGTQDVAIATKAVEAMTIGTPYEGEIDAGSEVAFAKDVADRAEAIQARAKSEGKVVGEDEARQQAFSELKGKLQKRSAFGGELPSWLPDFMKSALTEYVYVPGGEEAPAQPERVLPRGLNEATLRANMDRGYTRQEVIDAYLARQSGK